MVASEHGQSFACLTSLRNNALTEGPAVRSRSDATVEWLSNAEMIHGVRDATCGVLEAVVKNAGDASGENDVAQAFSDSCLLFFCTRCFLQQSSRFLCFGREKC